MNAHRPVSLFREFIMALSAASVVNRLRLVETLFHVFDLDDDGKITKAEIAKMLHTLVDVTESNQKHRQNNRQAHSSRENKSQKAIDLQKRIDDAFNELNANDDDHITKDEFIEWYIKSGLLSGTQTGELQVSDASRIQQLEKKTRKGRKHLLYAPKPGEEGRAHVQQNRHLSHMTEIRVAHRPQNGDDDYIESDDHPEAIDGDAAEHTIADVVDADSHSSKENERWQYLFNSVLSQIRVQRVQNQQQKRNSSAENEDPSAQFHSWKQDAEEKLKTEYLRSKSHHPLPANELDRQESSSSDVVRVRLWRIVLSLRWNAFCVPSKFEFFVILISFFLIIIFVRETKEELRGVDRSITSEREFYANTQ